MNAALRVLLYLRDPDTEIVLITGSSETKSEGAYRGRPVFTETELEALLDIRPSASEFRLICAAKVALSGSLVSVSSRPLTTESMTYSQEDEFIT